MCSRDTCWWLARSCATLPSLHKTFFLVARGLVFSLLFFRFGASSLLCSFLLPYGFLLVAVVFFQKNFCPALTIDQCWTKILLKKQHSYTEEKKSKKAKKHTKDREGSIPRRSRRTPKGRQTKKGKAQKIVFHSFLSFDQLSTHFVVLSENFR